MGIVVERQKSCTLTPPIEFALKELEKSVKDSFSVRLELVLDQ